MSDSKVFMIPDGNNNSIDPALMMALSQNGGFGGGAGWLWPMFMFMMYPWLFGGFGNGFGGGFGGANIAGTGYLANQLNNDVGRDLLLQAINGRADSLGQLANLLHTDVASVQNGINAIQSSIQSVGAQVGMSGQQVINSIQQGNANLSQQLCNCCCENRLAIANQTNAIQSSMAANHSAATLQAAQNQAATQLQMAQIESADQLSVCQQTNQLGSQADRNTNNILNAIAGQNTLITKEFCDLKERELQNKIDTQGDIITQLRGQISNDRQTEMFDKRFNALESAFASFAAKQPNTVPVQWPNLIGVNATPWAGGFYGNQTSFWN